MSGWSFAPARPFRNAIAVLAALLVIAGPLPTSTPALATTCPTPASGYAGGGGTAGDPYQVATTAQLLRIGATSADWGKDFVLTADIDLDGCVWTEIGLNSTTKFTGVFDGDGFTVRNLGQNATPRPEGFFGRTEGATIRDLRIIDADVAGGGAGVLAREIFGTSVQNVHVSGTVDGSNYVGGLIGSAGNAGSTRTTIMDSTAAVDVTASGARVGGLVGDAYGDTVTLNGENAPRILRSSASGSVDGSDSVGGLIGEASGDVSIVDSFATGSVRSSLSDAWVGGLIGVLWGDPNGTDVVAHRATIVSSYATGSVTASGATSDSTGGLVGYSDYATVSSTYSVGSVTGVRFVGGLIGYGKVADGFTATDSFWDVERSGLTASDGGAGRTTAQMRSITTYTDTSSPDLATSWPIVAGWAPYVANTTVWGICSPVNDGYPFLLWQYDADPCTVPATASAPSLAVSCAGQDGGALTGGVVASCSVSGGDPDVDIVWRAAYNPVFVEGVVRTGADGTGTFSFTVPVAAAGSPVTVELVAWTAPIPVGVASGPIPTSVPSGEGQLPSGSLLVAAIVGAFSLRRAARSVRTRSPQG